MKKYYKIYLDNDTNGMLLNILEAIIGRVRCTCLNDFSYQDIKTYENVFVIAELIDNNLYDCITGIKLNDTNVKSLEEVNQKYVIDALRLYKEEDIERYNNALNEYLYYKDKGIKKI